MSPEYIPARIVVFPTHNQSSGNAVPTAAQK